MLQDKSKVASAQLSLVDLAGSERTSRIKNEGDRNTVTKTFSCVKKSIIR